EVRARAPLRRGRRHRACDRLPAAAHLHAGGDRPRAARPARDDVRDRGGLVRADGRAARRLRRAAEAARLAARRGALDDCPPAAVGDVRPLGHRRALDQPPPADRPADGVRLRRARRRCRDRRARLRRLRRLGRGHGAPAPALPVRARLPVVRAEPAARQPDRAARQARRAHAPEPDERSGVNSTGTLRRVLLRPPRAEELVHWRELGWRAEPDAGAIAEEHAALCDLLAKTRADVVLAEEPVPGDPDAIYAYDPVLLGPEGAILLRICKAPRIPESAALEPALNRAGIPIVARLEAPATADGGDMFWLDDRTLLVGRSYRTNDAGIA